MATTKNEASPALLTYVEVEARTGLRRGTLYSMVARGEIPYVRLGRRLVRFQAQEIEAWLKKHSVPVASEVP